MSPRETPEEFRWRKMLFAVNEYYRNRDNPDEQLSYDQIGSLVGGEDVYEPRINGGVAEFDAMRIRKYQQDQIYLFKQLVDEGYINARLIGGWKGAPFSLAHIVGLTRAGHQFINEMSRDQDELLERFDQVIEILQQLAPEKKRKGEQVVEELKIFIRTLSHQEARLFIEQLIRTLTG